MNEIETLDDLDSGRYVVTTRSGTRHIIDLDTNTATRHGTPGREWDKGGVGFGEVTPDGETFHFWTISDATVGKNMRLSNRDEWRITSPIKSITRVVES